MTDPEFRLLVAEMRKAQKWRSHYPELRSRAQEFEIAVDRELTGKDDPLRGIDRDPDWKYD